MTRRRTRYDDVSRIPRAGTKLREFYDALLFADEPVTSVYGTGVAYLRDFYGCEIQCGLGCKGGSLLIGRWDGPVFVPRDHLIATTHGDT